MWKCPVCGTENQSAIICPQCGFDESCDYTRYPTAFQVKKSCIFTPDQWLAAAEQKKRPGLADVTEAYIQYLNACLEAVNSGVAYLYTTPEARAAKEKLNQILADMIVACSAAVSGSPALMKNVIIPASNYKNAMAVLETLTQYEDAAAKFKACAESRRIDKLESAFREAAYLENTSEFTRAATATCKPYGSQIVKKENSLALWKKITPKGTISAGYYFTVGVRENGTVVAVGANSEGQCEVSGWRNIIAISAGGDHTVGLKADGSVTATGYNRYGQCNVSSWTDIVAISAGFYHTVGLKMDGTVVAVGANSEGRCEVSDWRNIIAISVGWDHTVGLKADGTVVATGENDRGQCNVSDWRDIVAISAGTNQHTVGMKVDGTVVAVGDNSDGQCEVSDWRNIVAVSAGGHHTVGLKADGSVIATGQNGWHQCKVSGWRDIVAISAGFNHTVGLKADGSVVSTRCDFGVCEVSSWRNIRLP